MPIQLFKTKNHPPTHQDDSAPALPYLLASILCLFFNKLLFHKLPLCLTPHPASAYPSSSALFPLDMTLCSYMPQCPPLLPQPHDSAANCTITKSLISRVAVSWLCLRDRNRVRGRERGEREQSYKWNKKQRGNGIPRHIPNWEPKLAIVWLHRNKRVRLCTSRTHVGTCGLCERQVMAKVVDSCQCPQTPNGSKELVSVDSPLRLCP